MHSSFQPLLDTLERERLELADLLRFRSAEELNHAPGPGKWSAIQVMHHLIISEELSLGYLKKKTSFQSNFEKAGLKTSLRKGLLKIYLSLPFKFKAPKGVSDEALPAFGTLEETMDRWEKARQAMAAFLSQAPEGYSDKEIYRHPFAGKLTLEGMLEFFLAHFRRHREQVIRTLG